MQGTESHSDSVKLPEVFGILNRNSIPFHKAMEYALKSALLERMLDNVQHLARAQSYMKVKQWFKK